MKSDEVVLGPEAWPEIQRILTGDSKLGTKEQAFLLWFGVEVVEELLQYPSDVRKMSRETGLGLKGAGVAKGLLEKMKIRLAEIEKSLPKSLEEFA
jgi:hypothetical protein